ncbi:MAG: hypothetical protein OEY55_07565 [Acidimicrobiia bacterium]|nr:hypothetical protein [Acidimicrobiia bacterium]MDH5421644.1 hypothetical protein [Acidimicrobiia bacterium]MDH5504865.1 hypothetical protein [Acidimicrobiia bacterium]
MQRKLTILLATFFVVLTAGVAAAQVTSPDGTSVLSFFGFDSEQPTKDTMADIATDTTRGSFFDSDAPIDEPVKDEPVKDETDQTPDVDVEKDEPTDEVVDKVRDVDTTPPILRITSPEDGAELDDEFVVFRGVTEPGATVYAGDWKADVDGEGHWAIKLRLNPGRNRAAFVATDQAGNKSEASITVIYVVREVRFTAHQKYEASDAEIPGNRYYGTATPGAKIFVESKYGSGSTKATESGEWAVSVQFPNAPHAEPFRVVVESSDGGRAVFEMVAFRRDVKVEFTAHQKLGTNPENWDVFWGTAEPGTKVTARSEYGGASAEVNAKGGWEMKVRFEAPAGTSFRVTISDANGHSKVFEFTNPERDVVAFTANQKYGSCSEEVPYDVFWGTGKPGSTVWVGSPYGGGTTTVSGEGHWEIRVEFAEAPAGKTFEVVIEGEGGRKVFTFTNKPV